MQVSRKKSASLNKELQDVSFVLARKVLRPRLSFACGSSSRLFWICRFPDEHQETRRRRKPFSQPDPHSANRIDPDQRMKIWPITRRIVTDFRGGGMSRPRKRRCVPGSKLWDFRRRRCMGYCTTLRVWIVARIFERLSL